MRPTIAVLLACFAAAVSPLACGGTNDDNVSSPSEEGDAEDELRSLSLTDADNGKTVTVTKGQSVLVKLGSNPTTGYKWTVASSDLGAPTERFSASSGAVGSGGIQRLTFKTSGSVAVGAHAVKLEYKRPSGGRAAKTFSFTVNVGAGSCPQLSPPSPNFCPDGQIVPRTNANGCAAGYDCVASCPQLSPPSPNFCPDGQIVPRTSANGCAAGYDCVER